MRPVLLRCPRRAGIARFLVSCLWRWSRGVRRWARGGWWRPSSPTGRGRARGCLWWRRQRAGPGGRLQRGERSRRPPGGLPLRGKRLVERFRPVERPLLVVRLLPGERPLRGLLVLVVLCRLGGPLLLDVRSRLRFGRCGLTRAGERRLQDERPWRWPGPVLPPALLRLRRDQRPGRRLLELARLG